MRKIKVILRLHYECNLIQHQIAQSLSLSIGFVNKYLKRAKECVMTWPLPPELENERALKERLQPVSTFSSVHPAHGIDFVASHQELKRKVH